MGAFDLSFSEYPVSDPALRYAPVPWDTETFGFPVYELRLAEMSNRTPQLIRDWLCALPTADGSLVYVKLDQLEVAASQAVVGAGFYPVETVLEVVGDLAQVHLSCRHRSARTRTATSGDVPRLAEIARTAFWADRFHLDPNIPNAAADARYAAWIARAVAEGDRVSVLLGDDGDRVFGFYDLRATSEGQLDLALIALDPAVSSKGMGVSLYEGMIDESLRSGFRTLSTRIVARNLAALNILAHLGFSFRGALTTLHWFAQPARPSGR